MKAEVKGLRQLKHIGSLLEAEANPRKIKTAMGKQIRLAVKPIGKQAQEHAREILPKRGGLNEWVAASQMSVEVRTAGRGTAVRLTAKRRTSSGKLAKLQDIDQGTVRHPAWPREPRPPLKRKWVWKTENVPAGWFSKPAEDAAPEIQASLMGVLDDIKRRLEHN